MKRDPTVFKSWNLLGVETYVWKYSIYFYYMLVENIPALKSSPSELPVKVPVKVRERATRAGSKNDGSSHHPWGEWLFLKHKTQDASLKTPFRRHQKDHRMGLFASKPLLRFAPGSKHFPSSIRKCLGYCEMFGIIAKCLGLLANNYDYLRNICEYLRMIGKTREIWGLRN
jgi:hypothetical protein